MKIKVFLLVGVFFLTINFYSQINFNWANKIGGTSGDYITSMKNDSYGNIFVIGYFYNTIDLDPTENTYELVSSGGSDCFLAKYNSSGNFVWGRKVGGTLSDNAYSITIDHENNVIITGHFQSTLSVDLGVGTSNLVSNGSYDIYMIKYDNNGNNIWLKNIGGVDEDYGYGIDIDINNNIYITGSFDATVDFDPNDGVFTITPSTNHSIFFAKYYNNGNFAWAKNIDGDISSFELVQKADNLYLMGYFGGTIDFNPNSDVNNIGAVGSMNIFFAKYDLNGNYIWAKSIGGSQYDEGIGIAVDGNNNVYCTGGFQGTSDFDPSSNVLNLTSSAVYDIFIAKYDNLGNILWAKKMGGTGHDHGHSITTDSTNNIYFTGFFSNTVDFNAGTGVNNLTSIDSYDVFFAKYDSLGNYIWAQSFGGTSYQLGDKIIVDANDNILISGYFENTTDFDSSSNVYNLTSSGSYDGFFTKYSNGTASNSDIIENNLKIVYPNPAKNFLNIFCNDTKDNVEIQILDSLNRIVLKTNVKQIINNTISIENLKLKSGMYTLYLKTGLNNTQYHKIIIE